MARDPSAAANGHYGGEEAVLAWLRARIGDGPGDSSEGGPRAEVWLGDDTAVLPALPSSLLFATDAVVVGVHADLSLAGVDDLGWRAIASNVSDVAAMGGRTVAAVVSVTGPPATDVEALYAGLVEAARSYDVHLVGGDLTTGHELVVAVSVIGTTDGRAAVLRSGARPGNSLFVTGPLGAAAAGLRLLRAGAAQPGRSRSDAAVEAAVRAHRRPQAQARAGIVAACAGATAMMDVSDGFSGDLARLSRASGVDALVDEVPVAAAATFEEAVGGGDDYQLLIATPRPDDLIAAFGRAGLTTPIPIGRVASGSGAVWFQGKRLEPEGWEHPWGPSQP